MNIIITWSLSNNRDFHDHTDPSNIKNTKLLLVVKTPIRDHRKFVVWRILSPYLINVKKLSYAEGFNIINEWLEKCNKIAT
jgi:hypothetical protein